MKLNSSESYILECIETGVFYEEKLASCIYKSDITDRELKNYDSFNNKKPKYYINDDLYLVLHNAIPAFTDKLKDIRHNVMTYGTRYLFSNNDVTKKIVKDTVYEDNDNSICCALISSMPFGCVISIRIANEDLTSGFLLRTLDDKIIYACFYDLSDENNTIYNIFEHDYDYKFDSMEINNCKKGKPKLANIVEGIKFEKFWGTPISPGKKIQFSPKSPLVKNETKMTLYFYDLW